MGSTDSRLARASILQVAGYLQLELDGQLMSLHEWDRRLDGLLRPLRLIGEINLAPTEFEQLSQTVSDYVRRHQYDAMGRLSKRHTTALCVFLVFCGVYDYDRGNFWNPVQRRIGVSGTSLGQTFERFIRERSLECFDQFAGERALRYVAPILAHGGVPSSCLSDFFDLLSYTSRKEDWRQLPAAELIREWQGRQFRFVQIDVPIQRFLVYGGAVAQDFLQRAMDLFDVALDSGAAPPASETGLPVRISEELARWLARQQTQNLQRHATASPQRLRPPRVLLDPWSGEGPTLVMPSEALSSTARDARWSIGMGNHSHQLRGIVNSASMTTVEQEIMLGQPAARWDATFVVDGREAATWQWIGISAQRPVLAFDPSTRTLLRWVDVLPAGDMWLVYPSDHRLSLRTDGGSRAVDIIERFPDMWGQWRLYRCAWVQLPAGHTLLVEPKGLQAGGLHRSRSIPIAHDTATSRPRSDIDDRRVHGVWAGDDRHAVVSSTPVVCIPTVSEANGGSDIGRWTIVLTPREGSFPETRSTQLLAELQWVARHDGWIDVPLQQEGLLETGSVGCFSVIARGPLGQDARFQFALLPGLRVAGNATFRATNRDLTDRVEVNVCLETPVTIECETPDALLRGTTREYRAETSAHLLTLAIHRQNAALRIRAPQPAVTLHVPIAGVRWAATGMTADPTLEWTTRPVVIPIDVLEHSNNAGVLLDGFALSSTSVPRGASSARSIRLKLIDGEHQCVQERQIDAHGQRSWIALQPFLSTVQARNDASLALQLGIFGPDGALHVAGKTIALFTRELRVTDLSVSDAVDAVGHRAVTASWNQAYRVNDRALRLWPLARPWEAPQTFPIPDDVGETLTVSAPVSLLTPGPWHAEIIVDDHWNPETPRAMAYSPHATELILGSPSELRGHLTRPATSSVDVLQRFLLTRQEYELSSLGTMLKGEDPGPALSVLASLTTTADADTVDDETWLMAAIMDLRTALLDHPGVFGALLDHRQSQAARGRGESDLLPLLVSLGIPQLRSSRLRDRLNGLESFDRATLDREQPWVFLSRTGARLIGQDEHREDADHLLGKESLERLLPNINPGETREHPWCGRGNEIRQEFGYPVDPGNYRRSVIQLELIRETLGLVPRGAIDPETYLLATFDWLIGLNHPRADARRRQIVSWLNNEVARTEAAIGRVSREIEARATSEDEGICIALALLAHRSQPDLRDLEQLPYAVGAISLLQRLYARRPDIARESRLAEVMLIDLARYAVRGARRLYVHDLCLFDLLVTQPDTSREDHEVNEHHEVKP